MKSKINEIYEQSISNLGFNDLLKRIYHMVLFVAVFIAAMNMPVNTLYFGVNLLSYALKYGGLIIASYLVYLCIYGIYKQSIITKNRYFYLAISSTILITIALIISTWFNIVVLFL